ncbi:MAG: SRPBCC family protein [Gemmatimonadetes bacterium]|nr:SRPBCC family protein [Gemmatimonadota bacterium]
MAAFRVSRISPTVARRGAMAAGILALLTALFVGVGIFLPGTVEVTRSVDIDAQPGDVFPFLDDLDAWTEWTPWGDVESRLEGPSSGPGARRVWDDPRLGSGSVTIAASRPPHSVDYVVEVEGGALRFEGRIAVEPRAGGSLVTWTERADLGWNPLLGWTALNMEESQGRQLQESLDRLRERIRTGPAQDPTASQGPA